MNNPFALIPEAAMGNGNGNGRHGTGLAARSAARITPPTGAESYRELVEVWAAKLGIDLRLRLEVGAKEKLARNTGLTAEQVKTGLEAFRKANGINLHAAKGAPRPGKPAAVKPAPAAPTVPTSTPAAVPAPNAPTLDHARALGLEIAAELYAMGYSGELPRAVALVKAADLLTRCLP